MTGYIMSDDWSEQRFIDFFGAYTAAYSLEVLAQCVRLLEVYLQVETLRKSPAATLHALLLASPSDRAGVRVPVHAWPEPALRRTTARDMSWCMVPPEAEDMRYLHVFDKNAMYLGSAGSMALGLRGLERSEYLGPPDPKIAGYWRLPLRHAPAYGHMAHLYEGNDTWLATPEAVYYSHKYGVNAVEVWAWGVSTMGAKRWQTRIAAARAHFMNPPEGTPFEPEAYTLALVMLKQGYTKALGWLDGHWFRDRTVPGQGLDSPDFRPDWRHQIISIATANMLRRIDAVEARSEALGHVVVLGCHVDALYVLADTSEAQEAAGYANIPLGDALGEFKIEHEALPWSSFDDAARVSMAELRASIALWEGMAG